MLKGTPGRLFSLCDGNEDNTHVLMITRDVGAEKENECVTTK